jgi:hypothetical protein
MTTLRLTGNSVSINSTASVIPVSTLYGGNSTVGPGATSLYIYNGNTTAGSTANLMLSNTSGTFVFGVPAGQVLILNKNSTDTINSSSTTLVANPIAKVPN